MNSQWWEKKEEKPPKSSENMEGNVNIFFLSLYCVWLSGYKSQTPQHWKHVGCFQRNKGFFNISFRVFWTGFLFFLFYYETWKLDQNLSWWIWTQNRQNKVTLDQQPMFYLEKCLVLLSPAALEGELENFLFPNDPTVHPAESRWFVEGSTNSSCI